MSVAWVAGLVTVGFCRQRQDCGSDVNMEGLWPVGSEPVMVGRNPISDLEAVAGSPQLAPLAAALEDLDPSGSRRRSHPASLLVFVAGCWAFGSANRVHSVLQTTGLWETVVCPAAKRAGSDLPKAPPTADQVRQLLIRRPEVGFELRDVFTSTAVTVARQVGLLVPRRFDFFDLRRENTVYGDGSIWRYHSDVTEEQAKDAEAKNLKVAVKPRTRKVVSSDKGDTRDLSGPPVVVVGAHGGRRLQRVMLAVSMYPNGNETKEAMDEIRRVKLAAGDGFHFLSYDRLLRGGGLEKMLRQKFVPLVQMESARAEGRHIVIPERFRVQAGESVKSRAKYGLITTIDHPGRRCRHELWGIDGWVVTVRPGLQPHWESPRCETVGFEFVQRGFGYEAIATLDVPCQGGSFLWDLKATARREDKPQSSILNVYRPYPDGGEVFQRVKGWRSDAESSFRTLKGSVPLFGRATRHEPKWFQFDLIGAGIHRNAVAWDVHASQFTMCGARVHRDLARSGSRTSQKPPMPSTVVKGDRNNARV